jgi:hypothetical protein
MIGPDQHNNGRAAVNLPAWKSLLMVPGLGAVIEASLVPGFGLGGKFALQSNQPLERTPPRCARQRRSTARWASRETSAASG